MKSMAEKNYVNGKNVVGKWLKLFSPSSKLRFYPPQFIIRNPMIKAVAESFAQKYEVTVIVFKVDNLINLKKSMGEKDFHTFFSKLKRTFKQVISELVAKEDILILHDYNSDSITFLKRTNCTEKRLRQIDQLIATIIHKVEFSMQKENSTYVFSLSTGYMFVEKTNYAVSDAVMKAHYQAVSIADHREQSNVDELISTMNSIILNQNIRLLAQPIFEVATNRIKAYEVLTRGPAGTQFESPLNLFSLARQTGKLYELERIVLEKTFKQISDNESEQTVFINFTPLTVGNPRFINDIDLMLEKYPFITPELIVLEITERDPIDEIEYFISNITVLRKKGFKVAIDDTGSGYSGLNVILKVMPDIIKIDQSVIQDIDTNAVKESMLKGLLLISKQMGSIVVAEGIEREGEAVVLSRNNVELAQGYFYARPASVEKISVTPS